MFRTLINDAKSAAGAVIGKYAIRASVGVPFVIAAGFATAAAAAALVDRFGAIAGYGMMAGAFAVLGLLAAIVVTVKEHEEEAADAEAEKTDTANVASDATTQAAVQLPLALLGSLLTTPMGPKAAAGGLKILGRNIPLVLFLALVALLFWPSSDTQAENEQARPDGRSEDEHFTEFGHGPPVGNGVDQHVA